jgi:hypothetical protein
MSDSFRCCFQSAFCFSVAVSHDYDLVNQRIEAAEAASR